MSIVCPKCKAARPEHTMVPAWQCPSCGVVYAKAAAALSASAPPWERPPTPLLRGRDRHPFWMRFLGFAGALVAVVVFYRSMH